MSQNKSDPVVEFLDLVAELAARRHWHQWQQESLEKEAGQRRQRQEQKKQKQQERYKRQQRSRSGKSRASPREKRTGSGLPPNRKTSKAWGGGVKAGPAGCPNGPSSVDNNSPGRVFFCRSTRLPGKSGLS